MSECRRTEPELLPIDDEMGPDERAELQASFDRALDDSEAGRGLDAWAKHADEQGRGRLLRLPFRVG